MDSAEHVVKTCFPAPNILARKILSISHRSATFRCLHDIFGALSDPAGGPECDGTVPAIAALTFEATSRRPMMNRRDIYQRKTYATYRMNLA
ncbi:MAG TPA: hypothetical protein VF797_01130, partial [Noviherbaspirillum sp.]